MGLICCALSQGDEDADGHLTQPVVVWVSWVRDSFEGVCGGVCNPSLGWSGGSGPWGKESSLRTPHTPRQVPKDRLAVLPPYLLFAFTTAINSLQWE